MSSVIRSVDLYSNHACFHASFYGDEFPNMIDCVSIIRNYMSVCGGYDYAAVTFMDDILMLIYPDFVVLQSKISI